MNEEDDPDFEGRDPNRVGDRFSRTFAPPELYDADMRRKWKLGESDEETGPYVVELNLQHIEGVTGAAHQLRSLCTDVAPDAPAPVQISKSYCRVELNVPQWQALLVRDEAVARDAARKAADKAAARGDASADADEDLMRYRAIYKLWPDFPVSSLVHRSLATIKADAALRSFEASGEGIVWAVIDSGIDGSHPHFDHQGGHVLDAPEVRDLHRCFIEIPEQRGNVSLAGKYIPDPDDSRNTRERRSRIDRHRKHALEDDFGHGTHVAGIIAGQAPANQPVCRMERVERVDEQGLLKRGQFEASWNGDPSRIRGVAPRCKLISLRVLDAKGDGRSSDVIRALEYVRERLNDNPKLLRVHGVNLSVGYEFDAEMFACGQSPICAEVNRLVQSGVVVVAAAGNTGYGAVAAFARSGTKVGLSNTINDPGNADMAITVGATHRDSPHTYGVSYFSSKGPTGDGRLKPDLVAPGERITSCAAGARRAKAEGSANTQNRPGAYYIEDSGTSMAAPHVSGAIAAFLSIRREFIGKPLDVKRIFLSTATPLGRERYFEGHGLVDLIRAIQSV